jgi:RNA polymerase sigma factor (sigma-70 family)
MLTTARRTPPAPAAPVSLLPPDAGSLFDCRSDLLRRFRAGDQAALDLVYRTYLSRVTAIVRSGLRWSRGGACRPPVWAAMDLVHDVYLRAFAPAARMSFDGLRDYGPYLFAVARNVMIDWARREDREIPTDWQHMETLAEAVAETRSPDPHGDPQLSWVVRRYLDELEPALRAVHDVRYQRGLSQREAAQAIGLSRQELRTLEARLHAGLRRAIKHQELGARRDFGST